MSVPADVDRCAAAAIEALGHIDILVTCAGSSPGGLLEELTEEQWMQSLGLKFMGYVRTVRAVVPHMVARGSGSIVLVVGNDGLKPSFWEMTAGAANAADINFAASIADQYGPQGVRVNTINPGPVDTERWDTLERAFARDMGVDQAEARRRASARSRSARSPSRQRSRHWSVSSRQTSAAASTVPTSRSTAVSARHSWNRPWLSRLPARRPGGRPLMTACGSATRSPAPARR